MEDFFTVQSPLTDGVDNEGDGMTDPGSPGNLAQLRQWNAETVVLGRINPNTATVATLFALPYFADTLAGATTPSAFAALINTMGSDEQKRLYLAANLIGYRDRLARIVSPCGEQDLLP